MAPAPPLIFHGVPTFPQVPGASDTLWESSFFFSCQLENSGHERLTRTFSVNGLLCREQLQQGFADVFQSLGYRVSSKNQWEEISWPSWEDHEGFYRQDLHWMGLVLLGSEVVASGGAGSSAFTFRRWLWGAACAGQGGGSRGSRLHRVLIFLAT